MDVTRRRRRVTRLARPGSVYVLVLGASTMIAVIGIGAVALARSQVRATSSAADSGEAGVGARGGAEYMVAAINADASWRTNLRNDRPYGPFKIGRAGVAVTLVDAADGDLTNDASQPVRVYSTATVNGATRTFSALLESASTTGLDALRCALHSAGDVSVTAAAIATLGPISSNGKITNSASLVANTESATLSSTGFINGVVKTGVAAKTMPGNAAWTALSAVATTIPWLSTGGNIDKEVLTPGKNSVSTTVNASGVYLINVPAVANLQIHRCRLQATLLIQLGLGASLTIKDENLWDPPPGAPNQPSLIVQGGNLLSSVTISAKSGDLKESPGVNFNPPGAAYLGVTDSDTSDTYPNELHGLFHLLTVAPVTISGTPTIIGCVIAGGDVTISGSASMTANPGYLMAPPAGYTDPAQYKMRVGQGNFRSEVTNVNP